MILIVLLFIFRDLLDRHGVCIRILGDLTRLPRDVQEAVARAMKHTRMHNKLDKNHRTQYCTGSDDISFLMGGVLYHYYSWDYNYCWVYIGLYFLGYCIIIIYGVWCDYVTGSIGSCIVVIRVYLNVCFSYTSQQEITEAIQDVVQGATDDMILPR